MKKLFLSVLFVCAVFHLFAQTKALPRPAVAESNKPVTNFIAGRPSEGGQVVQKGITPSAGGVYKIGDYGPGGGFIFYAENKIYMECSLNLGSYSWSEAINIAKNYKSGNYTDWHLPTKEELNMIHKNLKTNNLGGLFEEWYWSSLESNSNYAWSQFFGDGRQYVESKIHVNCVRAVRAF
jgi:hypothetical protein